MLVFRVCLARDLPQVPSMLPNYIYFAYDKLKLYMGNKGEYQGNYAIIPEIPEEPSPEILYILETDGSVNVWDDYQRKTIAEIEDAAQIDLLKKASTSFFHYASHRYLDMERRVIKLPYENGNYELVVDIPNDIIVNDDTVLRYDVATERFIEEGDEEIHTPYVGIHGSETDTVTLEVVNERMLRGDVKLSSEPGNAIVKNNDGLFFDGSKYLTIDQYTTWLSEWQSTLNRISDSVELMENELEEVRRLISDESINNRILTILQTYFPTINTAISNYNTILNVTIPAWLQEAKEYSDRKFYDTKDELMQIFGEYFNNPWENEQADSIVPDEDLDPQLDDSDGE